MTRPASRPSRMRGRIAPQALLILSMALALGAGLWAGQAWFGARPAEGPQLAQTLTYPTPRELPPFTLQQSDGTGLTRGELEGRWTLVFFGFTHCPDICPTTLAQLAQAQASWSDLPESERPRVLFVSVDPERDSPQHTGEYAQFFGKDILAATAGHDQLGPFARSLGMVYMQSPLEGGGYSVDHSSRIAVLDPEVRLAASISPPAVADTVASDMRALVASRQ